jgi:hypothetical protein
MRERTLSIIDPASAEIVPPPRRRRKDYALHLDAVQVVRILGLLPLTRSVVGFAALSRRRLPSPSRRRGHSRVYSDASVLLIALLTRPWRLSSREVCLWLGRWPALAAACGLPAERGIDPAHLTRRIKKLGPYPFWLLSLALGRTLRPCLAHPCRAGRQRLLGEGVGPLHRHRNRGPSNHSLEPQEATARPRPPPGLLAAQLPRAGGGALWAGTLLRRRQALLRLGRVLPPGLGRRPSPRDLDRLRHLDRCSGRRRTRTHRSAPLPDPRPCPLPAGSRGVLNYAAVSKDIDSAPGRC